MEKTICFASYSLASRAQAAQQREIIKKIFENQDVKILLDFSKVQNLSASYADELFGILAQYYGIDSFIDRIKIQNASRDIYYSIASAIHARTSDIRLAS